METDGLTTQPVGRRERPVFWDRPGLFECWALSSGMSPASLARLAKQGGYRWVAIQDRPATRQLISDLHARLAELEIDLAVWQTRPVTIDGALDAIWQWNPDAYIAEVETRDGWDEFPQRIRAEHPDLPRAIVTNYWGAGATPDGYDRSEAQRWWGNGWACLPEAYAVNEQGPQPTLEPDKVDWLGLQLGFPRTFPVLGVYRCPLNHYDEWISANRPYSVYPLENL